MTSDTVIVPITAIEEHHLAKLVDDFLELLVTSRDVGDPAIDRLAPNPYPDDPASAAGFVLMLMSSRRARQTPTPLRGPRRRAPTRRLRPDGPVPPRGIHSHAAHRS